MALLWIEGFEGLDDEFDPGWNQSPEIYIGMVRKYELVGSTFGNLSQLTAGRFGGYAIKLFPGTNVYWQTHPLTTDRTLIVGTALYLGTRNGANPARLFTMYDGDNLEGMNLRLNDDAEYLEVWRGNTLLNILTGQMIPEAEWFYIEFKVYCDDSAGTWEVRLNGNLLGNDSGVDTKGSITNYHQAVRWDTNYSQIQYDDIYVCDGTGTKNNDFLGVMRVVPGWPGTDHTIEWETMVGAPDHSRAVNEIESDDDSLYIEDDDTGNRDIFDYENIIESLGPVAGVMLSTLCRETDAQNFDLINVVRSGGTEYDQPSQQVGSTSYVHRYDILESDPDTGLDWTQATVNAAQFGVKVG